MADETVNVKIKFNANTRELKSAMVEMSALKKMEDRFSSGRKVQEYSGTTSGALKNVTKNWKKHFDHVDAGAKAMGKMLGGFLKLAIKGVVVEMALLSASMVGIHALFVAGQFAVKAYKGAMGLLAQGAAFATVAIAAFSAALREQQAAMYAYRGKGAPQFGSAMNQTRMAMRNMQSDAALASLGIEALNKAYGTMSKTMNTVQLNQSTAAIKALMDFGSAGQDPAKGLEQVAVVISTLKDKKKGISDVITEAKKLGPEMEKAVKDANIKTKKQFEQLLMSGDLAKKGGVSGQFAAVNSTLMSQLKGYMTTLRSAFADVGDYFLEPLKKASAEVFDVLKRDMQRILGSVQYTMGTDGYFDGIAGVVDKVSNWMVKTIREYLPATQNAFSKMGDWFQNFKRGWNYVLDQTRPMIDGARVLYKAWDPIWQSIKRAGSNLTLFRSLLLENKEDVSDFGERIAGFIDKLSDFFGGLKRMFADMAPFINDLISGLTNVFGLISGVLTKFAGGGLASALAPLMAFSVASKKLSSVKGGFLPGVTGQGFNTNTMHVNAGNVIVGGAGPIGPGGVTDTGHVMSSGKEGAKTGGAAMAESAMKFKSSGGSIAKAAAAATFSAALKGSETSIGQLGSEARNSLLYDIKRGSQLQVQNSNLEDRRANRFSEKLETGRGFTYALMNKMTGGNPYADPSVNPEAHAMKVLQGRSRKELADQVSSIGRGGDITQNMSRNQLISLIQTSSGYNAKDYLEETARPSLGEGAANTAKSAWRGTRAAGDRVQYGARRVLGGARGAMQYLSSGAWDAEKAQYNDLGDMRAKVEERYQQAISPTTGRDTRMGRFSAGFQKRMSMNRINRNYSKFGNTYNNRFAKSTGGRMGAGMALGLASQYAPEEMRGAMALGGMAAQIDPRLGLAVAGLGGAMTARGGMKGALSGAAGGAALGGQLGPYGALAGAAIGGVFGAIMGSINKGKYEMKMAKEAATAGLSSLFQGITAAASTQFLKNKKRVEEGQVFNIAEKGTLQGLGRRMAGGRSALNKYIGRSSLEEYDEVARTGVYKGEKLTQAALQARLGIMGGATSAKNITFTKNGKEVYNDEMAKYIVQNSAEFGMEFTDQQKKDALTKPTAFLDTLRGSVETDRQLGRIDDVNAKRIAALSAVTNKSGAELEVMANTMGINLYDATVNYDELLQKFTKNLIKNKDQLNASITDVFLAGANPYKQEREKGEAQQAANSIGAKIKAIGQGGGTKKSKTLAINAQMEQLIPSLLAAAGGDAMKAYQAYSKLFVEGKAFGKGQQLEGMQNYFNEDNAAFTESSKQIKKGISGELGTQVRARVAGKNIGIDQGLLENAIANMSDADLAKFKGDLDTLDSEDTKKWQMVKQEDGSYRRTLVETNKLKGILSGEGGAAGVKSGLADAYNLTGFNVTQTSEEALNEIASTTDAQRKATEGLDAAITLFNENASKFMTESFGGDTGPQWWNKGLKITGEGDKMRLMPGDTSSPRGWMAGDTATSKLSQTMGRHAAMDGQLTGKRTVTSSLRNYALGSPSSDHATGSAYDLTGQNLGMYARMVHANGGFAEFHGTMGDRHLHVVPGPGLMGDTSSPRQSTGAVATATAGANITNYYSFEISGGDADAIANRVMEKIRQTERSMRERS